MPSVGTVVLIFAALCCCTHAIPTNTFVATQPDTAISWKELSAENKTLYTFEHFKAEFGVSWEERDETFR